jgi:hypothetical protein
MNNKKFTISGRIPRPPEPYFASHIRRLDPFKARESFVYCNTDFSAMEMRTAALFWGKGK